MKITDFAEELKKIDAHINIKESPQAPDVCGIYYDDIFMDVAIPNGEIKDEVDPTYVNIFGTPHKTIGVATAQVNNWLANKDENLEIDSDFKKLNKKK